MNTSFSKIYSRRPTRYVPKKGQAEDDRIALDLQLAQTQVSCSVSELFST